MPRIGRVVLPNYPHPVVQRGHNRQVVFADALDFEYCLSNLREIKEALGLRVYAYCLMTNHVHLLLSPGDTPESLGQLMKALAACMTRYLNKLEGRSGTFWESRYKSSVAQTDTYLLACSRYIELNPVRAGIVSRAENYRWSSYRLRANHRSLNNRSRPRQTHKKFQQELARQSESALFNAPLTSATTLLPLNKSVPFFLPFLV
jgi:putative transposase